MVSPHKVVASGHTDHFPSTKSMLQGHNGHFLLIEAHPNLRLTRFSCSNRGAKKFTSVEVDFQCRRPTENPWALSPLTGHHVGILVVWLSFIITIHA